MKYFITIFATAVIVLAGAFIYFRGFPIFPYYDKNQVSTESAITASPTSVIPTTNPNETPSNITIVKAGGVLVFNTYSIDVPNGWGYSKEAAPTGDVALDKLILTKGLYKITIFQAATGGAPCLYPEDSDVEGPFSRYVGYVEITTGTGDKLRRSSGEVNATGFTVCELQSGGYGQPTTFGHISISTPTNPSKAGMDEIDSILSSLKKL